MTGLLILLIVAIICATILFGLYMYYCSQNEVGLFQKPKYEKRIRELEKKVAEYFQE